MTKNVAKGSGTSVTVTDTSANIHSIANGSGTIAAFTDASVNAHNVDKVLQLAREFFEPHLKSLGLSQIQIEEQSLERLEQSLDRVNEAISKPDTFGNLNLKFDISGRAAIILNGSETNTYEVNVLPVLLERKKLILERISSFKKNKEVSDLKKLVKETEEESRREKIKQDEDINRLLTKTDIFERRSKIWLSFLEREPAAIIVGTVLLILIPIIQIIAILRGIEGIDILNNAFLIILGYFFGQAGQRGKSFED